MEIRNLPENKQTDVLYMHGLFEDVLKEKNIDGTFNYVEISGNSILPEDGWSVHEHDEFSIILEGELDSEVDGKLYTVRAGDYTYIKKGTQHRTYNRQNEICKIVSLLI
ncbi:MULTISPECIES: cupin domain-containing protein [Jeotgalicoccus]|uniref:cupin domain-containing protein n=1 Tax=Jeotgalicoccus TaxID=227979 RepID=UPI0004028849|nr:MULTISPECIES: cupin domain-containing protein [Jeotgalicoccus]QQD84611.1 cupin domain-containing protein [Jeotgalicoccus sp. ATCC 8456]